MAKKDEDLCPLCGAFMDTRCIGYRDKPFADGRTYEVICHCCYCVPKTSEYDPQTEKFICIDYYDGHINTVEEMVSDGWEYVDAKCSVKAVKAAFKKRNKKTIQATKKRLKAIEEAETQKVRKKMFNEDFSDLEVEEEEEIRSVKKKKVVKVQADEDFSDM